jgi:UDP-arabinose 4-epimerase
MSGAARIAARPGHRVLVTGGAGYIGSHTCKALARAGFVPVTLDNLSQGRREAVRWGPLVEADLADRDALDKALRRHRVQAVVHFAAHAYVGESMRAPGKYFRNNVANGINLLEAMAEHDVRGMVFSSTCATYGLPQRDAIAETHPQRPVNWHGVAHGLRWAALRYFNAAGADPEGELGEEHDPETHLVPLAIRAALGDGPALEVFGTDYDTPDGTAVRDYVHVSDLAAAHVCALRHLLDGGESIALNLGTGTGHSVREVLAAVERVSGRRVPAHQAPRRPGDPPVLVADPALAREVLGWTARHSRLDSIVRSAWRWHCRGSGVQVPAAEPRSMAVGSD